MVHGVVKRRNPHSGLDSLIIASAEGVTVISYLDGRWERRIIGTGDQGGQFKGSGEVDIGKIGTDTFGYVATVEPAHGKAVAVYKKNVSSIFDISWERQVLDIFGPQDSPTFEGVAHHLVTADFDGDCHDEFIVALSGPWPIQGVFYYDPIDAQQGLFTKTRISSQSAARTTLNDFNGDGKIDFATIGYALDGYYQNPNSQLWIFINKI